MSSLFALDNNHACSNIPDMSVTLDMSKLSGWLNAALCRVTPRLTEDDTKEQRREGRWGQGVGGRARARGAHVKHIVHVRDAGRVEAQRLVERRRGLPSRKGKHKTSGDRRAWRRKRGGAAAAAQAACRQRTQVWRRLAGARAERT